MASNLYRIHVDYELPLFVELKKKYDRVSDLFDGRPWERHSSCKDIDEKPGEREFFLAEVPKKFLGKRIGSARNKLAIHFSKLGYRFAIEIEAHHFACAHPELQSENDILALGSSARDDVGRHVASLAAIPGFRPLGDCLIDLDLIDVDRLLLVRK